MRFKITKFCKKRFSTILLSITLLLVGIFQTCNATILNVDKTVTVEQLKKMILIDASNLSNCQKESVTNAKCIPTNTFQSGQGELASFYHITWVLGTAGIQGSEELLVFADDNNQRDALLGLLYLAGQKKVKRWNNKKSDLQQLLGQGIGETRSIIRTKYYTAKMRDEYLALPYELESLKKQGWYLSTDEKTKMTKTIIYAEKPLDALAVFTRLLIQKTKNQILKIIIHSPTKFPSTLKSPS